MSKKYTSKNFHLHYIPQYTLLIKIDFLVDTLLVLDESNHVQVLYSYPANQPDGDAIKLLGLPFQHIFINVPVQSLVFIPDDVFDDIDKPLYQEFLLDEQPARTYEYRIPNFDIMACYQFDLLLYNRWRAIFPNAKFVADFQWILGGVQSHIPLQGEVVGTHFRNTQLELFVFKNGAFQMYNIFDIDNENDLHYFMLTTFKALGLSAPVQKILVSGIAQNHSYAEALHRFSEKVEFMKAKTPMYVSDEEIRKDVDSFNLMLDYPLCVS